MLIINFFLSIFAIAAAIFIKKAGVKGGTVLDSTGMISYLQETDESYILGSLRLFLETTRPDSKTMFFIIASSSIVNGTVR